MSHCPACKWKDSPGGCPFHIDASFGLIETNGLGEVRLVEGCFMREFFRMMGFVTKAAVSAAAAVEGVRNDIVARVEDVGYQLERSGGARLPPRPLVEVAPLQITKG